MGQHDTNRYYEADAPRGALTPNEKDMLQRYANGESTRRIGHKTHRAYSTVRNTLTRVHAKLGVETTLEAVVMGLREGWLQ